MIDALQARHNAFAHQGRNEHEWRRLQYDAVRTLVESQRVSVELHRSMIATQSSDDPVRRRLRFEALDLTSLIEALHRLIREIERTLGGFAVK